MPFKFCDATISARPLTIADDDDVSVIAAALSDKPGSLFVKHVRFAEFMVAAEFIGKDGQPGISPIPHVTENDDAQAIRAAYEAWRTLPRRFADEWRNELERAEGLGKNGG